MFKMHSKDQMACMLGLISVINIACHNTENNINKKMGVSGHDQHLLILMGRGADLRAWMKRVLDSPTLTHVALVVGIFDDEVTTLKCSNTRVSCVSVAGTTWTTGRNKLIDTAHAFELKQNTTYTFWTLADADLALKCTSTSECFQQYDTFLSHLPQNATAATLIANGSWPPTPNAAMVQLRAMDAAWNSFRRTTVQMLFPYQPDLDASTWWSSQAIFWHRMQCLAPLYVVAPLYIFYINQEHTNYPRNPRNYTEEHRVGNRMTGNLSAVLAQAPEHYSLEFKEEKIRPLPLVEEPMDSVFYQCLKEFTRNLGVK
jgi:hypothetical protein